MPKKKKNDDNNSNTIVNNNVEHNTVEHTEIIKQSEYESDSNSQISLSSSERNLKKYNKERIPSGIRKAVWNIYLDRKLAEADCYVGCGGIITKDEFQCGHIQSEAKGGEISIDNLRPICNSCNQSMGPINMLEYMKKYKLKCPYEDELFKKHNLIKSKKNNKYFHNIELISETDYNNKKIFTFKLTLI